MSPRRLVADAGGTNVRFAIADESGRLERVQNLQVADFPAFKDALSAYGSAADRLKEIDACAIAAAGPVDDGVVKLTNNEWTIDRAEISSALAGVPVAVVNDLEAVAAALPHLASGDLTPIGAPAPARPEQRTMLAVNVGTGFGAASAILRDGRWYTCPSEVRTHDARPDGGSACPARGRERRKRPVRQRPGQALWASHRRPSCCRPTGRGRAGDVRPRRRCRPHGRGVHRRPGTHRRGPRACHLRMGRGLSFAAALRPPGPQTADAGRFRTEFTRKGPMRPRMLKVPTAVIRRDNAALFGLAMMPLSR